MTQAKLLLVKKKIASLRSDSQTLQSTRNYLTCLCMSLLGPMGAAFKVVPLTQFLSRLLHLNILMMWDK